MDKMYRFSPIKDEKTFNQVLEYLVVELEKLSQKLLNESLPITILKVFPHYLEEYDYLHKLISQMGPEAPFSSKTNLYVKASKKIGGHNIEYLGVRIVDPYRLQVGCGDYEVKDLDGFKAKYINTSPYIRESSKEMVEIWHPDFDVLGYVVDPL